MMRYVIMVAGAASTWEQATPEQRRVFFEQHAAFEKAVSERGRRISSAPLAGDTTATTLRHDGERWTASDGPFAELSEQIGGYYDVELPDLDAAIEVSRLLPPGYTVEIRPTIVVSPQADQPV